MESERTQEYLEAIYKRQDKETPVSTSSLARDLKVSQPAVTDMLGTLEKKGLIDYKTGKGTILTDTGRQRAIGVIRRHRLWERFLTDILGMRWDKVHDEACRLEHVSSPDIEEGLSSILGNIDTCPHGHSIPDKRGNIKPDDAIPLSKLRPAQKVRILTIDKEEPKLLRTVKKMGLEPQTDITILKKEKDGSVEIAIDNKKLWLDKELSAVLMAKPISDIEQAIPEEIPLTRLVTGRSGIVKTYSGGRNMLGRCLSLGLTPGSIIKMLENYSGGPVLVKIHDTEIALGRGLAEKISVTPSEKAC